MVKIVSREKSVSNTTLQKDDFF